MTNNETITINRNDERLKDAASKIFLASEEGTTKPQVDAALWHWLQNAVEHLLEDADCWSSGSDGIATRHFNLSLFDAEGRKEPPPLLITPTPTPSGCLAEDYERARRDGEHVRVLEDGIPAGFCWCREQHDEKLAGMRDIHTTTVRASDAL